MSNPLRHRRTKGIIAAACGVALLFTGGTFALWSDSESAIGGKIIAGDLDIRSTSNGAGLLYDLSRSGERWGESASGRLRQDQTTDLQTACAVLPAANAWVGHKIDDSETYRVTPADTVGALFPFQVRLEGDNLVAALNIKAGAGSSVGALTGRRTYTPWYEPYDTGGVKITVYGDVTNAAGIPNLLKTITTSAINLSWYQFGQALTNGSNLFLGNLQAPSTGQAAGDNDPNIQVLRAPVGADANVCVLIEARVPNFTNQDLTATENGDANELIAELKTLEVGLTQIRTQGVGHF